jgi:hypothetical protein
MHSFMDSALGVEKYSVMYAPNHKSLQEVLAHNSSLTNEEGIIPLDCRSNLFMSDGSPVIFDDVVNASKYAASLARTSAANSQLSSALHSKPSMIYDYFVVSLRRLSGPAWL